MKKNKPEKEKQVESVDSFSVRNAYLKVLYSWIDIPVHSEKAIARNRVAKLIEEKTNDLNSDRLLLVDKYGKRDSNGELMQDEKMKSYILEDEEKFNKEYSDLINSFCVFDVLPSNREYWKIVRDMIKKTKVEMDIQMTNIYEEILEELNLI